MAITEVTAALVRARPLPSHDEGDKESRGRLLAIAGSLENPGAALLVGEAALASGAGKLTIATAASCTIPLGVAVPEARVVALPKTRAKALFGETDAIVIGPGMEKKSAHAWMQAAVATRGNASLLLDAAALLKLWTGKRPPKGGENRTIITPHAGELATMMSVPKDAILSDPFEAASKAAAHLGMIVVLKGPTTVICAPQGPCFLHRTDLPGLAVSGSGDVLAGIVGGLLARGTAPIDACLWGVFLHAEAGKTLALSSGPIGYRIRELSACLPRLL